MERRGCFGVVLAVVGLLVAACLFALPALAAPGVPASPTFPWQESKSDEPFFTKDAAGRAVIAWRDNSDNEEGFRVEVAFGPGGERFDFRAPANAISLAFPADFDFGFKSQAECRQRRELTVRVFAFNAAGESPLAPAGQFILQRECFGLPTTLPNAGAPRPTTWPLAVSGMFGLAFVTAGLVVWRWAAR